ncbi:MAG: protein-glutamate O-methyltransferase CheR [Magnetococcus sp. DMHC-8]
MAPWHTLVRARSGLSFDASRVGKLLEGLEDRMSACGLATPAAYWQRVHDDPGEFAALVSLLTVNETYFFRGIEELRLFAELLVPEWQQQQRLTRPLSVVSAGCASGEEAYSIAMVLLDSHGDRLPFVVHGGDVDGRALAVAQAGQYGENAFRNFDAAVRARYFVREAPGRERIDAHLRSRVHFFALNLMADHYPAPLHGVDFIFYRNVSIYFDEPTKQTIFARLMAHLAPGGCLLPSPAEIFFHNQSHVRPGNVRLEDRQGRFFFRKLASSGATVGQAAAWPVTCRPARDAHPVADRPARQQSDMVADGSPSAWRSVDDIAYLEPGPPVAKVQEGRKGERKKRLAKVVRLAHDGRHQEAMAHLDQHVREDADHDRALTLKAAILLHCGDERESVLTAGALCRAVLARDALSFEALVLLAMALHQAGVDPVERIAHLKAAIFLQPSSWLPHFYLAQTFELLDELPMAAREYQVVMHQMAQPGGWQNHGLTFLPLSFSAEELIHICRFRLQHLQQS